MAKHTNLTDIANQLNLSKSTVISRFEKLNIQPLNLNHKLWYLSTDVESIRKMKTSVNYITPIERFSILEYFLSHRDNGASDLEKVFFIPQFRINRIISDYLKNGMCVTVPSKMNRL